MNLIIYLSLLALLHFQKNGIVAYYFLAIAKLFGLLTYQQPTKVTGMVVGSDAPTENPCVEETAHAPLGGASPSHIENASELDRIAYGNELYIADACGRCTR